MHNPRKSRAVDQVIFEGTLSTVWSAPNYCYRCGNLASILEVSETLERTFNMFEASEKSVIDDPTLPDVSRVRGRDEQQGRGTKAVGGLARPIIAAGQGAAGGGGLARPIIAAGAGSGGGRHNRGRLTRP